MTRKHFRAIAEAIATISDDSERREVACAIADMCVTANRAFDRTKFYVACNLWPDDWFLADEAHHGLTGG